MKSAIKNRMQGLVKGRATQAHSRGTMGYGEKVVVHAQANRVIGKTFHSHKGK
jgi:hypothetical protein